jgi:hypothetical protein
MRFFGENLEKYYVTIKIFDNDDDWSLIAPNVYEKILLETKNITQIFCNHKTY